MNENKMLGIEPERLERWFGAHIADARPPLRYERIVGGHSNLTYLVTDASDVRYVLRRPPLGDLLATAHNVTREHDIMEAVAGSGVPVPSMLGVCHDESVTDAPFYVMGYVDGVVLHSRSDVDRLLPSEEARRVAGESMVDALVALHAIDVDAAGLGDLARRVGFLERQLKRWSAQWDTYDLHDLDGMPRLHEWLMDNRPPEGSARIVHGDFRLGNALLGTDGALLAIVDWELCTLGDPFADVAYLLRSWAAPDARFGDDDLPSLAPGFPTADALAARYAAQSGASLEHLDYWLAFTAWRAAAILGGVYRRYLDGKMGVPPEGLQLFRMEVESRLHQGLTFAHLP